MVGPAAALSLFMLALAAAPAPSPDASTGPKNDAALNARARSCAKSWQAMKPASNREDRSHRDFYKTCMGIQGPAVPDLPEPTYTNPRRSAPAVTAQPVPSGQ